MHFFAGDKHFSASSETGEIRENSPLFEDVTVTRWDGKEYESKKGQTLKKSKSRLHTSVIFWWAIIITFARFQAL